MYAIIETGGKQYRVSEGDTLYIEKIQAQNDETIEFDKVLAFSNDKGLTVGKPYVENAKVTAKVDKTGKAKKILVFKYKPKKGYRKMQGHRQPYTKITIMKISV